MEKIINTLKNSRLAQGAIALGGVAAVAYLLLSGENNNNQKSSQTQQSSAAELEEKIQEAIQQANKINIQGHELYDFETACRFQDILVELAIPEFTEFAVVNREERRQALKNDEDKYFKLILEYNDKMLALIGLQQEKLKKYPEYSEECMSIAISAYMRDQRYMQKIIYSISKLKASIPPSEELSVEDSQQIIAFFTTFIKSQPAILVHLVKYLAGQGNSTGIIYPALKTALFDQLFLEKGLEEEDYLQPALTEEFTQNQVTQRLQQMYSTVINEFMEYHKD